MGDFVHNGTVNIHRETWQATSDMKLQKGQKVKVTDIQGLTLKVEPLPDGPAESSILEEQK